MSGQKPPRTCPECVHDGGFHYTDDLVPKAYRCPNYLAATFHEQAQQLTAEAHKQATEAARRIVADAAATRHEFSANDIRTELDAAQIPGPVVGGAFRWAKEQGLIVKADRRVMSNEPSTRHPIDVWRAVPQQDRRTA